MITELGINSINSSNNINTNGINMNTMYKINPMCQNNIINNSDNKDSNGEIMKHHLLT